MRYFEIKGGIHIPLSIEEQRMVKMASKTGLLAQVDLDERDAEVARLLCGRGVFLMIENEDDSITYKVNKLEDIWRD